MFCFDLGNNQNLQEVTMLTMKWTSRGEYTFLHVLGYINYLVVTKFGTNQVTKINSPKSSSGLNFVTTKFFEFRKFRISRQISGFGDKKIRSELLGRAVL